MIWLHLRQKSPQIDQSHQSHHPGGVTREERAVTKNTTAKISLLLKREPLRTLLVVEQFIIGTLVEVFLGPSYNEQYYYMLPSNNLSHNLATVFHVT